MDNTELANADAIQVKLALEVKHAEVLLIRSITPIILLITTPVLFSIFLNNNTGLNFFTKKSVIIIGIISSILITYFSYIMFRKFYFRVQAAKRLNGLIQRDINNRTLSRDNIMSYRASLNRIIFPCDDIDKWDESVKSIKNEKNKFKKLFILYSFLYNRANDLEQFYITDIFIIIIFFVFNTLSWILTIAIFMSGLIFLLRISPF